MEKITCAAKLSDESPCLIKAKDGSRFCAMHLKFAPKDMHASSTTMDVTVKELVKGINYFVDHRYIYNHGEVLRGQENPAKIGEYESTGATYAIHWY
jgi:hypothetical protein